MSDLIHLYAYVKRSSYRTKILEILNIKKFATPTELSAIAGIRVNHISKVLKELKDKNLIICHNEDMRKGRLYSITVLGADVYRLYYEQNGITLELG